MVNAQAGGLTFLLTCEVGLSLKTLDTIGKSPNNCKHKNLLGDLQWTAVDSITHCEKRLPLK